MQPKTEPKFIKIGGLENAIEAQLIGSILGQREIPHRIQSFYDTAYNGLFQVQKGWGMLYAPAAYKLEIRQVIDDVRSKTFYNDNED